MSVRINDIETRLSALEAYVGEAKEPRGMTLSSRIEAQHSLLIALREDMSDTKRRLTRVEDRLTGVEGRLTALESSMGVVLHGITTIKNLLRPPDDPGQDPPLNGSPLPVV
jgi:hypothetical protein